MNDAVCARAQMLSVMEIALNTCPFTDVACIWAKPATCVGRVLREYPQPKPPDCHKYEGELSFQPRFLRHLGQEFLIFNYMVVQDIY